MDTSQASICGVGYSIKNFPKKGKQIILLLEDECSGWIAYYKLSKCFIDVNKTQNTVLKYAFHEYDRLDWKVYQKATVA